MKNKSVPEQTATQVIAEAIALINDHLALGVKNERIVMMLSSMFRPRRLDHIMVDDHAEVLSEMRYKLRYHSKSESVSNGAMHGIRSLLEFAQEHSDKPPGEDGQIAAD
jgi:hypothetical protein